MGSNVGWYTKQQMTAVYGSCAMFQGSEVQRAPHNNKPQNKVPNPAAHAPEHAWPAHVVAS